MGALSFESRMGGTDRKGTDKNRAGTRPNRRAGTRPNRRAGTRPAPTTKKREGSQKIGCPIEGSE